MLGERQLGILVKIAPQCDEPFPQRVGHEGAR
jgi:hypothetical protein